MSYDFSMHLYKNFFFVCVFFTVFILVALFSLLISYFILALIARNRTEPALIPQKYRSKLWKWVKIISLPICLSIVGYIGGFKVFEFWQIQKFNQIVKKITLFESENGRVPNSLEEIGLIKGELKDSFYVSRGNSVNFEDDNCIMSYIYFGPLWLLDTNFILTACKGKPNGPPHKYISKSYGDYKWYRINE